jgi:mannosyltransferase OCH1-like enzyme
MASVSNLKASRSMRLVVAAFVSLTFIYFFNVGWNLGWKPSHTVSDSQSSSQTSPTGGGHSTPQALPKNTSGNDFKIHHFTSDTAIQGIPDKVWHSAKTVYTSAQQQEWINSWTDKNPSFRQELLTDRSAEALVRAYYQQTRPDIVDVYEGLSIPILRADLFRYLIILAEGGYWSDLDVSADKPSSEWVPTEYKGQNIDMIVGLEFDFETRGPGTEVASQFCNWVFSAKPSSRNLQVIVDAVVSTLKKIANDNNVSISGITLEMLSDVVNVTGPKIMTISILDGLTKLLGREVDDRDFSGIKHPKLVGDVLIMPGVSFAAAQNGYPKDQGDALVSHHYEGSWKQADAEAKERKKQQAQSG